MLGDEDIKVCFPFSLKVSSKLHIAHQENLYK